MSLDLLLVFKAAIPFLTKILGDRYDHLFPLADQAKRKAINATAKALEEDFPSGNFVAENLQFDSPELKAELEKLLAGEGIPDRGALKELMAKEFGQKWPDFSSKAKLLVDKFVENLDNECLSEPRLAGPALNAQIINQAAATQRVLGEKIDAGMSSINSDIKRFSDEVFPRLQEMLSDNLHSITDVLSNRSPADNDSLEKYIHEDIDTYRDMLNTGSVQTAMTLLQVLRDRRWEHASPRVKFRITTNIGAAKLRLGDDKGAAVDFLQAIQYDPTDRIGMANVALAHLLLGEESQAIVSARAALGQDPKNPDAASYLIMAHHADPSVTDPADLVSAELLETHQVRFGIISFYRRRSDPRWEDASIEAALKFPDVKIIRQFAAEAVLDNVLKAQWFQLGEKSPAEDAVGKLRETTKILQSQWDDFKKSEAPLKETALPHNLALGYQSLGDAGSAAQVLDEALAKAPHSEDLLLPRAVTYLAQGDENKALDLLTKIKTLSPSGALIKAELLLKRDPRSAREILKDVMDTGLVRGREPAASVLLIKSYVVENNWNQAIAQAIDFVNSNPTQIEPLSTLFRVQKLSGTGDTTETLRRLLALVNDSTRFYDRYIAAEILDQQEQYDELAEMLAGRVDCQRDSYALQLFLKALIKSDRRTQTRQVLGELTEDLTSMLFYSGAKIDFYMICGDFPSAKKAAEKYLSSHPKDLAIRLRWIDLCMRDGEDMTVLSFLNEYVDQLTGNPHEELRLAGILEHFDLQEKALRIGYRILLMNRKDPKVHLGYVGLFLAPNRHNKIDLNLTEVTLNAVVTVENEGHERITYLIEPEEQLRTEAWHLAPNHPTAKMMLGRKVTDVFSVENPIGLENQWRIIEIKHKYLHALHESMQNYQYLFPNAGGLWKFDLDWNDPKASLEPIVATLKAKHDQANIILDKYDTTGLPIDIVAKMFGINVIQARQALAGNGSQFHVCRGSLEERDRAIQAICKNEHGGCVLDALTFYLMRRLGVEDAVLSVCGPIGLTETTVDVFRDYHQKIASEMGQQTMTLYWKDGQVFRGDAGDDTRLFTQRELDSDIGWIKENCDIIPAHGDHELPATARVLSNQMPFGYFDPLLAADGANRLLVCEDLFYRTSVSSLIAVGSSWLQPVLMEARKRGVLSGQDYSMAIVKMLNWNTEYISIDYQDLLTAAFMDDADGTQQIFASMVQALGGPSADMKSHCRVAALFIGRIWNTFNEPTIQQKAQTSKVLECLLKGRHREFETISAEITRILMYELHLRYFPLMRFLYYLHFWLKGHFLLLSP